MGRAEDTDGHVPIEQSADIPGITRLHRDRLTNAAKVLSIDLATGAVSNGGRELTRAAMVDLAGILFRGAPATFASVESMPSTGTLQISTNENDEFIRVAAGDTFEGEQIYRIYFKTTGTGSATVRLNSRVSKAD